MILVPDQNRHAERKVCSWRVPGAECSASLAYETKAQMHLHLLVACKVHFHNLATGPKQAVGSVDWLVSPEPHHPQGVLGAVQVPQGCS